jgi:hypothetical protein
MKEEKIYILYIQNGCDNRGRIELIQDLLYLFI